MESEILATLDRINNKLDNLLNASEPDKPLSHLEAARFLGVSKLTLYAWTSEGKIAFYKNGSRNLFRKADLIEFAFRKENHIPAKTPHI